MVAVAASLFTMATPAQASTMDPLGCPEPIEDDWYDGTDTFRYGPDATEFPFGPDDFDPQSSGQGLDLRLLEYIACVFSYAVHASVAHDADPSAVISHLESIIEGDSPAIELDTNWWQLCPDTFPDPIQLATSVVDVEQYTYQAPVYFGLGIRCGYALGDVCPEDLELLDTSSPLDLLDTLGFTSILDYVACTFEWEFRVAAAASSPPSNATFDAAFAEVADCFGSDASCLDAGWEAELCPGDPSEIPGELATHVAFLASWWPNQISDPRNWQTDVDLQGLHDGCAAYEPPGSGDSSSTRSIDEPDVIVEDPDVIVEDPDVEEATEDDVVDTIDGDGATALAEEPSRSDGSDGRTQAQPIPDAEESVDSTAGEGDRARLTEVEAAVAHARQPIAAMRSTIVRELRTPAAAWADPRETSISVVLALLLVLMVMLPSQLFNSALAANTHRIRGALPPAPAWLRRVSTAVDRHSYGLPGLVSYALVAALVLSFLDPGVGMHLGTATTITGLALGLALLLSVKSIVELWFARRRGLGRDVWFRTLPWALPIALLCVLLSRAVGFLPGYLYGLIAGVWFGATVRIVDQGRVAMSGGIAVLATSIVAWFAWWSILPAASESDAPIMLVVGEVALATTFIAGIQGALIGWLPIRWFDGDRLHAYSRPIWAAMYAAAALMVVHVLLRPETGYTAWTEEASTLFVLSMFVVFGLFATAFYAWFRLRPDPSGTTVHSGVVAPPTGRDGDAPRDGDTAR